MSAKRKNPKQPSVAQRAYLSRGLDQPGGKLPLFDERGTAIDPRTVRACVEQGWAEPWFDNPLKPGWLVCKLTMSGRMALEPQTAVASIQNIKKRMYSNVISLKNFRN